MPVVQSSRRRRMADEDTLSGLEDVPTVRHDGRPARAGTAPSQRRAPTVSRGLSPRRRRGSASRRAGGAAHRRARGRRRPRAPRLLAARPEPVSAELQEPRARQPLRRRHPHRPRLRQRLHRASGRRLDGIALVRALLLRPLPRCARVARVTVPQADPYLLPMAALLTAVGVTEIYRLDPDNAFRQGLWIVVGARRVRSHATAPAPRLPAARELQVPLRRDGALLARPPCAAR